MKKSKLHMVRCLRRNLLAQLLRPTDHWLTTEQLASRTSSKKKENTYFHFFLQRSRLSLMGRVTEDVTADFSCNSGNKLNKSFQTKRWQAYGVAKSVMTTLYWWLRNLSPLKGSSELCVSYCKNRIGKKRMQGIFSG